MNERTCNFADCDRPCHANGYCKTHSEQLRRTGRVWSLITPPPKPVCSIEGCERTAHVKGEAGKKGWCKLHHERWKRHGDPTYYAYSATLWDRFWPKVDASGDCWEWTAAKNQLGYGQIGTTGKKRGMAHRVAWELLIGPIGAGLELDHLCRNRACVNPDHLEPVTHEENMRRAPWEAAAAKRAKTHCPKGHPYSGDNLLINSKGRRECKSCKRASRTTPGVAHAGSTLLGVDPVGRS